MSVNELNPLELVVVGQKVWMALPDAGPDLDLRGGTVWAIEVDRDLNTGFLQRRFNTVKWHRGRWVWDSLRASDVDPATAELMNSASVKGLIKDLAREVVRSKLRTAEELRPIDAMHRLRAALG